MKHMLDKLAAKQGSAEDQDDHAEAKMQVLHELRNMAMGMMGDRMKDKMPHEMHGVEVMAPDQQGLKKGLDLAQKVLPDDEDQMSGHGQPDRSHAMENDGKTGPDHLENPGEDEDDMSDDELDSMLAELQAKKASRDPRFQK
jgi:hypothetical protein